MVFQNTISRLRNLASQRQKTHQKIRGISTETQTARGEHEEIQFNLDIEGATGQLI